MKRNATRILAFTALVVVVAVALGPRAVRAWWTHRSSNPVRRGVQLVEELGCFSCHGVGGREGIADPAEPQGVPGWSGGVWMMYTANEEEVRQLILHGGRPKKGDHADDTPIRMPAYADRISDSDLDDVIAAFRVLADIGLPARESLERRGLDLASNWDCFACHGLAGSGGLPNPGSFAGFIPGWYGADFRDLVRNREEFDAWIRRGSIPRLDGNPIASFFLRRQEIRMPAYRALNKEELDALWAYVEWLDSTDGGVDTGELRW